VLGMVDTSYSLEIGIYGVYGDCSARDAATLLPIINAHVAPGMVGHTDKWTTYRRIGSLPNISSHIMTI